MGDQMMRTHSEAELDPIRILEAALFMSSKPLSLSELARVSGIAAPGFVEEQLRKLQEEYARKESALAISCEAGKYLMRLKPEYEKRVGSLAGEADVSAGAA
ncbi:MAG: SMC-Scp complex subunit ScpB, partial [Candidatus Micrarchaeota archaeon]